MAAGSGATGSGAAGSSVSAAGRGVEADALRICDSLGFSSSEVASSDGSGEGRFLLFFSVDAISVGVDEGIHLLGSEASAIGLFNETLETDGGGETEEAEGSESLHCVRSLL